MYVKKHKIELKHLTLVLIYICILKCKITIMPLSAVYNFFTIPILPNKVLKNHKYFPSRKVANTSSSIRPRHLSITKIKQLRHNIRYKFSYSHKSTILTRSDRSTSCFIKIFQSLSLYIFISTDVAKYMCICTHVYLCVNILLRNLDFSNYINGYYTSGYKYRQ